ncbi:hypothetical protein CNEO3_230007 [Clostridium neonatale]|nr:hypothetical protein CNEO3_230007 [Clostridium neonatale]CAI3637549.1 hypothetical protein CNEO4_350009 [Clostridium neonatale]
MAELHFIKAIVFYLIRIFIEDYIIAALAIFLFLAENQKYYLKLK